MPHAVERFATEAERLYGVVDRRLTETEYLAGDYSIADIACFPWLRNHQRFSVDIADYANVARWLDAISARPAVQRGLALLDIVAGRYRFLGTVIPGGGFLPCTYSHCPESWCTRTE